MRGTSPVPTISDIVDGVWDELIPSPVSYSTAQYLKDASTKVTAVQADYTRRTAFTYGPTALAAGAYYTPAAGTLVTSAILVGVAAKLEVYANVKILGVPAAGLYGHVLWLYCDGTLQRFKNTDGAGQDLEITGMTP